MYNADKTKISIAKTDILDECLFNNFYMKISEKRRQKIDRLLFDKDRRLSLGAELVLLETLYRYGYEEKGEIRIETGEYGKPFLPEHPEICFNLSHSGEYVMCVVSDRSAGCDIQKTDKTDLKLAEKFFLKSEYEIIYGQDSDDKKREMFYRYWTLKESFLKATGRGFSLPLNSFELQVGDRVGIIQKYDERDYYFREFSIDGYKAAVCTADRLCESDIEEIDLRDVKI